jgi:two-component system nitrate/nitrite sensor histidine kinase NarX
LVEDDGVGFEERQSEGRPGEHIGLSIMQERARRLGGRLRIESEPGEGTRVELRFRPADRLADAPEVGGR